MATKLFTVPKLATYKQKLRTYTRANVSYVAALQPRKGCTTVALMLLCRRPARSLTDHPKTNINTQTTPTKISLVLQNVMAWKKIYLVYETAFRNVSPW